MIDPRTTNIVGQRVLIKHRGEPAREVLGSGIVRVIDYHGGSFSFLIEALGEISSERFGVGDGGLFEVSTSDESVEVVVDRTSDAATNLYNRAVKDAAIEARCKKLEKELVDL